MSKNLEFSTLLDLYGNLISEKQYEAMDYYYNQDLSLSEIGELLGISRQAVRNNIKKGEENILQYEENLGLYKKLSEADKTIEKTAQGLKKMNEKLESPEIEKLIEELLGIELI